MSPVILDGGSAAAQGQLTELPPVQSILLVIRQQLNDLGMAEYDDSVLLPYVNLAVLEVVILRPDAYPRQTDVALVAGAAQSLPTGHFALIDPVANLTSSDAIGSPLKVASKEQLDSLLPGWMTWTPHGTVDFIVRDPKTPAAFYVFPPQPDPATGKVRLIASRKPADILDNNGTFPLADNYRPAVIDDTIYRVISEESAIQGSAIKAKLFHDKFLADLGMTKGAAQ